jgi:hypothetical protein
MCSYITTCTEHSTTPPFVVQVVHDAQARCWIGTNDELPVATEAATLEELMERVWQTAPEVADLNQIEGALRLKFVVDTEALGSLPHTDHTHD